MPPKQKSKKLLVQFSKGIPFELKNAYGRMMKKPYLIVTNMFVPCYLIQTVGRNMYAYLHMYPYICMFINNHMLHNDILVNEGVRR